MIPVAKIFLDDQEKHLISEVIDSGWITQGPMVEKFEREFARRVEADYAVAVSNCTTGLFLSLHCAGIGRGDEVIVPSFSFIASANAIVHIGASPVFVDIDPDTYNVDLEAVEKAIGPRVKAIMPVHQVGQAADLDRIYSLADKHGLAVIEDAACAIGSQYKNRPVGSRAKYACFSFHPRKVITTGEGGMITTNDLGIATKLRLLRHQGMAVSDLARHKSDKVIFESYPVIGYNFRLTDVQAAIGLVQLTKLPSFLEKRARLAKLYNELFSSNEYLQCPYVPDYSRHNFQSYILRFKPECPISCNALMQELLEKGIATRRGVMCSHLELAYADIGRRMPLDKSECAVEETMIIPLYPGLTDSELQHVVDSIMQATMV